MAVFFEIKAQASTTKRSSRTKIAYHFHRTSIGEELYSSFVLLHRRVCYVVHVFPKLIKHNTSSAYNLLA
jgi:hypothetical protein